MKTIAIIATVIASTLVLASCATKSTADNGQVVSSQTTASSHHDFKGEMSK